MNVRWIIALNIFLCFNHLQILKLIQLLSFFPQKYPISCEKFYKFYVNSHEYHQKCVQMAIGGYCG